MTYSLEERIFLVLEFHRLGQSVTATRRSFQSKFQVTKGPQPNTIKALYEKFQRTGSVADEKINSVGRHRSVITEANVQIVEETIARSPRKSVRKTAAVCHVGKTSVHTIMRKSLNLFPYKIQTQQPLQTSSVENRKQFANDLLEMIDRGNIDVNCIWFSDEAHFHLDGFVNKQNWRIWGTENPHVCVPQTLYSPKVTVWAAVSSRGVIGPVFLRDTVTSKRYIEILREFVAIENALVDSSATSWFMQDGARPHRTADVFRFLEEYFDNRVIALNYSCFTGKGIDWPPYSPDLNPCDFFLWGHLKDAVYRKNPQTLEQVEEIISDECAAVSLTTLQKMSANFVLRLRHLIAADGAHFENIVL